MVVFLVFNDVVENGDGAVIAEVFQLLAVVGDVAAFFDFEAAQCHADSAGAIGEGVGFAAEISGVYGFRSAKFNDAAVPESGMFPLGAGKVTQYLGTNGIGVAIGQGFIGVIALHLGLPIGFDSGQNLFQLGAAECGGCHFCVSLRSFVVATFASPCVPL